jgi:Flp pilus assembly protein TadD
MRFSLLSVLGLILFPVLGFSQFPQDVLLPLHTVYGTLKITAKEENRLPSSFIVALQPDRQNEGWRSKGVPHARNTDSVRVRNRGGYRFDGIPDGHWVLIVFAEDRAIYSCPLWLQENSPKENQIDLMFDWDIETLSNVRLSGGDFYPRKPSNTALFDQATIATSNKDYAKAVKLLRTVLNIDPKDFEAWTDLGTVLFEQGNKLAAEEAYKRALGENPSYPVALLNYGKLQYGKKDYDAAIQTLSQLVGVHPESAEAHRFLGEAYLSSKKGSKAVPELEEAVRLDPEHQAEAYLSLGALYDAAGSKDEAAEVYTKFLALKPNYPNREELSKYIQSQKKLSANKTLE